MRAGATIRSVRHREGLSLRALAHRAGTSHATLLAYENGTKMPSVETFDRILRAAGFDSAIELSRAVEGVDRAARGAELAEALRLASLFPARDPGPLRAPRFGRP